MVTVRSGIAHAGLRLVRTRAGGSLLRWAFAHIAGWLPLDTLHETGHVIAFRHPAPSYPTHILIVPKRAIRSLATLTDADMPAIVDVINTAHILARRFALDADGCCLVVNGGAYQEIRQLHFHLIAGG